MLHYIRDLAIPRRPVGADYGGMNMIASYVLFHFLRAMGWTWLWECDSQNQPANHCPDGDTEEAGVASWTALGTGPAVLSKDSATKHQGYYSLKVASQGNADDGARTALLTNMENSVVYRIAVWASNNTGSAWDVDADTGTGSFTNVGTIPDNSGVWTLYHFTFTTNGGGSRYVRFVDTNVSGGDLYIDDLNVFRSWFEYNLDNSGTDGDVQNGDEFSSVGYTFVAGDVGKVVVFYDPTNLGNSGAYTVDSINSGNAVLDLRAGGSETLINTATTALVWRLLDLTAAPLTAYVSDSESGAGWGLQSPHTDGWRLFFRHRAPNSSGQKAIKTWSSPISADFSVMTGEFSVYEPSTARPRGETYDYAGTNDGWYMVGMTGTTTVDIFKRMYAMVASGGELVSIATRTVPEYTSNLMGLFGISGSDALHTNRESFVHYAKRNRGTNADNEILWNSVYGFASNGACGSDEGSMPPACIGLWNTSEISYDETDNQPNIYSGEEMLQRPIVLRDQEGVYGFYSEKEFTTENALWCCRSNLTEFTPFAPVAGDLSGGSDGFAVSGSTVTCTDTAAEFTADMVGREITIAGSTTNDGTFVVTGYTSPTVITWENGGTPSTEAGAGTWSVGPQYMHFEGGVCWKWPGITAIA